MWLVYALGAAIVWGYTYTAAEGIFRKISPLTLLAVQGFFNACVYLFLASRHSLKSDLRVLAKMDTTLWLVLSATACYGVANLLISLSIQSKNATLAALIELTYPVFTILFSWLLFRQAHLSWNIVIGGFLIIAGAAIIGYFNAFQEL